jgi:small conductance mechanosensitive channel
LIRWTGILHCGLWPGRPETCLRHTAIEDRSDAVATTVGEEQNASVSAAVHIVLKNRRLSMMIRYQGQVTVRAIFVAAVLVFVGGDRATVRAQVSGMPGSSFATKTGASDDRSARPAQQKSRTAVATSSGPIAVDQQISDDVLRKFLGKFLPKYPGVSLVKVGVDDGVVLLRGRVDNDDSRDEITDVVKRVEGVRLVLNQMKTDEEVMTAAEFARLELNTLQSYFARKWLLILLSLLIVATLTMLARLFSANAEIVLAPFVGNVLLRSVIGSLISSLLVVGGLLLALGALGLTHVVVSILGVASILGLAVGFAFRDITENFIASVLLGVRRPFQIGDYVTIAGQSGVVKSLNTRATVLVTLEGNHVRIPNATIFKEIMVNSTASPSFRHSFDVMIPHEASAKSAIDAITKSLCDQNSILSDPPPRALVEALEPGGVRVRAYFWSSTRGVDWFQLRSDAILKAKGGLHLAGILGPTAVDSAATIEGRSSAAHNDKPRPTIRVDQAMSNVRQDPMSQTAVSLRRDANAAVSLTPLCDDGSSTPMEHVLEQPETRVSTEGANLLKGNRPE